MSFDEATAAVRDNATRAPVGSRWRHLKTGGEYTVLMHVLIEATLAPAVIYRKPEADPTETWCRPGQEFFDGRFEQIDRT